MFLFPTKLFIFLLTISMVPSQATIFDGKHLNNNKALITMSVGSLLASVSTLWQILLITKHPITGHPKIQRTYTFYGHSYKLAEIINLGAQLTCTGALLVGTKTLYARKQKEYLLDRRLQQAQLHLKQAKHKEQQAQAKLTRAEAYVAQAEKNVQESDQRLKSIKLLKPMNTTKKLRIC